MQGRQGRYQLRIPSFLEALPSQWARDMQWMCTMRIPRTLKRRAVLGPYHPHVSFVHACMVARVAAMSTAERKRFLADGAKLVFESEIDNEVPGRERVRLHVSDTVKPVGIEYRAA